MRQRDRLTRSSNPVLGEVPVPPPQAWKVRTPSLPSPAEPDPGYSDTRPLTIVAAWCLPTRRETLQSLDSARRGRGLIRRDPEAPSPDCGGPRRHYARRFGPRASPIRTEPVLRRDLDGSYHD